MTFCRYGDVELVSKSEVNEQEIVYAEPCVRLSSGKDPSTNRHMPPTLYLVMRLPREIHLRDGRGTTGRYLLTTAASCRSSRHFPASHTQTADRAPAVLNSKPVQYRCLALGPAVLHLPVCKGVQPSKTTTWRVMNAVEASDGSVRLLFNRLEVQ